MPNPFVHIELSTTDLKRAKKFYSSIFGWKLTDMPGFDYTMVNVGEGTGGGMQQSRTGSPSAWLPYVQVDDVKKTLAKAARAGAEILVAYQPIGNDMGALGVVKDPTGAPIGFWEASKAATKRIAKASGKKASRRSSKKAPSKKAPAKKTSKKKR